MELDSWQAGALESDQVLQTGGPAPQLPVASMPGFRFQPTEEELVGFYLQSMVMGNRLEVDLINVLNLYRYDPWELPAMAFMQGEREWLFFCPRDKKYPNGARPNRVTASGYWKATGTDRPVRRADDARCIGLKKTLVFYTGKAPRGRKTEWIMNEYRLLQHEHSSSTLCLESLQHFHLNSTTTDVDRLRDQMTVANVSVKQREVALCRIYKKPFLISAAANLFADSSIPDVVDSPGISATQYPVSPSPKRVKLADGLYNGSVRDREMDSGISTCGHNIVKLETNHPSSNSMGYEHPRIPGPVGARSGAQLMDSAHSSPDQNFIQRRGERSTHQVVDRLNWVDSFGGEGVASSDHNQLHQPGDLPPSLTSMSSQFVWNFLRLT